MDVLYRIILLIGIFLPLSAGQCTLPFTDGTWISSTRGTWTVSNNGTTISNFKADLSTTLNTATLNCVSRSGTKYVLGTQFELFFLVTIDVYTCLDIRTISGSPNSYVYYIVTPTDSSTGEQFTSDQASVCSNSNYNTPVNTHIVLKGGSETAGAINLPDAILGNYSVDYVDINSVSISGSEMDSCTDKTIMVFNNSSPTTNLAFTNGDILHAIYSVTSGSNVYLHTYNNDTSVDGTNTFNIACWVIVKTGSNVKATVYPNECIQEQTSTSVAYGGQKFTFTPYFTCASTTTTEDTSESSLEGWQIVLIVLGVLACLIIIVILIVCFLYMRKSRHVGDDKKGFAKETERQSSPDSLPDVDLKKSNKKGIINDCFDTDDEITEAKKRNKEKEKIFSLKEVNKPNKSKKLEDMNVEKEPKIKPEKDSKIKAEKIKDMKQTKPVPQTPRKKPEPRPQTPPPQVDRKQSIKTDSIKGRREDNVTEKRIEIPPGKKAIPPTTPRPDAEDTALLRIKKERERKEKERDEKRKKEQAKEKKDQMTKTQDKKEEKEPESRVIKKNIHSSSSDEYETDEEDKNERIQKLFEKRKRLEAAGWSPTGATADGTIVGKKKKRKYLEGDAVDMTTSLTTREEQEMLANRRKNGKKNLKKIAKKKLRSPSDVETSDTDGEGDVSKKKRRRRRGAGIEAPFTKEYHEKKGIEKELDDIDFWQMKQVPTVLTDEDDSNSPRRVMREKTNITSMKQPSKEEASSMAQLMQDETDKWESYGMKELVIGEDGSLPDGFHFDEEGNIIRNVDGKKIPKEAYEKMMENRKKFGHVFSIPRLIRNSDGRPLGGYKNDEFGPYEEWDYGDLPSGKEEEDDHKKTESQRPISGRQVAFSVENGPSAPTSPIMEADYNIIKGRQLGSAERMRLNERLFEAKQQKESEVPVFFANIKKGGVKSEPVYIDAKQLVRQDCHKPPPGHKQNNMVKRSDTFDDGRMKLRRNTRQRSSWSSREATIPDFIPEENESGSSQTKGIQGLTRSTHNIGSVDEFILVGGSMQRLDRSQAREPSNLTDMSMRTAPDSVRPFSGGDKRLRRIMPEFYPDQKYFQYYLDTEKLPTNAALETRDLASHGRDYLLERAGFWQEKQPVNLPPPPSELGLRLQRMRTFHTTADSGMHSMMSSSTGRPHSADDAPESTHRSWTTASRETTQVTIPQVSVRSQAESNNTDSSRRLPPTGRSEAAKTPSTLEKSSENTKNETAKVPNDKGDKKTAKSELSRSTSGSQHPGNVLSITDHVD
ncbi:hypothetical protein ACF0H5_011067 [Mactra antiquata]